MLCNACGPGGAGAVEDADDDIASKELQAFMRRLDQMEQELKLAREELDAAQVAEVPPSQPRQELAHPAEQDSGVQLEEVAEGLEPKSNAKLPPAIAACDTGEEVTEQQTMTERDKLEKQIIHDRELYRDDVQEKIRKRVRYFQQLGLSDTDGIKANDLTGQQRDSIDEDYFMKQYAKDKICGCTNASEIIMKAELLIDEDWLDKVDALPGNLFSVGAFGEIFEKGGEGCSLKRLKANSKYFGCCLVILIQLLGPPLIFMSRMPQHFGVTEKNKYEWGCHPLFSRLLGSGSSSQACPNGRLPGEVYLMDDWREITITKLMGIIFITGFILNGLFSILDERNTWKNLYNTFRFLDWKNAEFKAPGAGYLFTGAVVNCWVVVWSCLDIYVVAGACADPQDLLMDALALLFLFNLDDVDGVLCFVDNDDWPGLRIAWIYQELVHPWPDDEFDEDKLDWVGQVSMMVYKITIALLCLELAFVPVLAAITPFIDIVPGD